MRNTKSLEIKVGIVSTVAIILLVLGITFAGSFGLTANSNIIKIKFKNSGGIKKSNPVSINGLESGSVLSVSPVADGVIIEAIIPDNIILKSDATAIILLKEITGGKKIEINPGTSNSSFDLSSVLQGQSTADIGDLVAVLGDVSGDAVSLLKRLDTLSQAVNEILLDKDFSSALKNSVKNLDTISGKVKNILNDNERKIYTTIDDLSKIGKSIKDLLNENSPKVKVIIDELDVVLKNVDGLIETSNLTIKEVNDFVGDLRKIINDINTTDNSINKLIRDEQFAKELDSAFINLKLLLNQFQQHGVNVNVRLGTRP